MVKEVIWSAQALKDRKSILQFWIANNHSNTYSIKLDKLFRDAVLLISEFPRMGKPTDVKGIRAKRVREYYIFYQEKPGYIAILSIWDTRQDSQLLGT